MSRDADTTSRDKIIRTQQCLVNSDLNLLIARIISCPHLISYVVSSVDLDIAPFNTKLLSLITRDLQTEHHN